MKYEFSSFNKKILKYKFILLLSYEYIIKTNE